MRAAWSGLRAEHVWDMHVHLFGNGRQEKGVHISAELDAGLSPIAQGRRRFFMNAGCVGEYDDGLDGRMVGRLTTLVDQLPPGAKVVVLAFDFPHDEAGRAMKERATFGITNDYARRIAAARPDRFEWMASIHPYREDAVEALTEARAGGARGVKWLPPSMGIDLASSRCRPFYAAMKKYDLPLLIHVGEEQAAPGAERHEFANPLLLRHPLEAGVRVIAAHCATLGESEDLDRGPMGKAPHVPSLELFKRLMADRRYEGRLFGDIAAITQANRPGAVSKILALDAWDGRLLNGSDYPLPGVIPLFSLKALVTEGVLAERLVPELMRLRHANALLFDFALKRSLRLGSRRFTEGTFETKGFFARV